MKPIGKRPERIIIVNGRELLFAYIGTQWWVALKPICDALGVNFNRAYQNLKLSPELSQLFAKQQITGADGKQYSMVCLPHSMIYGWLFSLQTENPIIMEYRMKCYQVLYDHFSGSVNTRSQLLMELRNVDADIYQLDQKLMDNMDYVELEALKGRKREITKQLKALDESLISPQLNLFATNNTLLS